MAEELRLLVVDDEPGMRKGAERVLRRFTTEFLDLQTSVGFSVEQAASGEEALEAIDREVPDILLLDYKLPGISGLEVQEKLAEQKIEILTVMISAYGSLQTVISATKHGAFDFLAKPFTPDELRTTLRRATHHFLLHRQALKLAEERRQIRFEFIRVLGHELKSPLAAVEGYLDLMKIGALGDSLSTYTHVVERSLIRLEGMRKLISDLLDLTRIESGNKQRSLVELEVCEAVEQAVETALPEADKRGISIATQMPGSLMMTADQGELEIILSNLISNAVKYNRDNGSVTVTAEDLGEQVRFSVADTGIGMSPEETEKLFGEFVRIKNERTAAILGSGLGLSIIKKLVALYEGDVSVESEADVGSTFTVVLGKSVSSSAEPAPAE